MRLHWKSALDPLLLFMVALGIGTIWLIGPIAHKKDITISRTHVHRDIERAPSAVIPKASGPHESHEKKAPDARIVRAELAGCGGGCSCEAHGCGSFEDRPRPGATPRGYSSRGTGGA